MVITKFHFFSAPSQYRQLNGFFLRWNESFRIWRVFLRVEKSLRLKKKKVMREHTVKWFGWSGRPSKFFLWLRKCVYACVCVCVCVSLCVCAHEECCAEYVRSSRVQQGVERSRQESKNRRKPKHELSIAASEDASNYSQVNGLRRIIRHELANHGALVDFGCHRFLFSEGNFDLCWRGLSKTTTKELW